MTIRVPRIVVSGLRGGLGKTVVTLGIVKGWQRKGLSVAPFKKGPDFIDASWLRQAAGRACFNLDTFLAEERDVLRSFTHRCAGADAAIIEGNRGLFDGMDVYGSHSTANLAKLLQAPVILTLDCTKATRTMAALVLGCQHMDTEVAIKGVILNQLAGNRHSRMIRATIEKCCNMPVLGEIPKLNDFPFQERHMGLTPPEEHPQVTGALALAEEIAAKYLDVDGLQRIAGDAPPLRAEDTGESNSTRQRVTARIGVIQDSAFQFYYPENIEALQRRGGEIIKISAIEDRELPAVDGLYIGGGFPETHAEILSDNAVFRHSVREAAEAGMPIYAECGGAMYLGRSVSVDDKEYPMTGFFPVSFNLKKKPQGHGYTILESDQSNPFFKYGTIIRGHEFHYSRITDCQKADMHFVFKVKRGYGFDGKRDGLCRRNVLSTYTHIHALGEPRWADALVSRAEAYRAQHGALHAL